jgi:hypothetical protein
MNAVTNLMETAGTFSSAARKLALITRGHKLGPITRLVRLSGLGKRIKPFVLLNLFDVAPSDAFLQRSRRTEKSNRGLCNEQQSCHH